MEPITQGLLGAATAYAAAGRRLGRPALFWGALLGMSPDLDVALGPLDAGFGEWIYHRGTTHSLWFGFVAGPAAGWALWRWRDPERQSPLLAWILLAVAALLTHPLLDGFTPYGTQFWAPFSRTRIVWNGVAIVDPIYTLLLGSGVLAAVRATRGAPSWSRLGAAQPLASPDREEPSERADTTVPRRPVHAGRAILTALCLSSLYLGFGLFTNQLALRDLETQFAARGLPADRVRAYPTIFQPWLRHFVLHSGESRFVGFHSLFSRRCPAWTERRLPAAGTPARARLEAILATRKGQTLRWFADGDFGFEEQRVPGGVLSRLDDLRYAWISDSGRGMWGVEARFDSAGQRPGPVRRFAQRSQNAASLAHFGRALRGQFPGAEAGWARNQSCADSEALAAWSPADTAPDARGTQP